MRPARALLSTLAVAIAVAAMPAQATDFGQVELVKGPVSVQAQDGHVSTPRVGDTVPSGAQIVTGRDGELQIATADSGFIAVRPNTRLRIADYRAEGDERDTQALALLRGTFRSITGWIGRYNADRYRVTTPAATIGVRGTDHEPSYWLAEDLDDGDDEAREEGTYDKVNEGASFIENESGRVDIASGQAGFAKFRGRPARLKHVPRRFRASLHEKRIVERREFLKSVREKRRIELRERLKQRHERAQERRKDRRDRHRGN